MWKVHSLALNKEIVYQGSGFETIYVYIGLFMTGQPNTAQFVLRTSTYSWALGDQCFQSLDKCLQSFQGSVTYSEIVFQ
jgi:hypothetical protein